MDLITKNFSNEKQILFMIKFAPPAFILVLTTLILIFIYKEFSQSFETRKYEIKENFLKENKVLIKNDVEIIEEMIKKIKASSEEDLKKQLKDKINEGHLLATEIYNKYKDKKSKEEIFELIKNIFDTYRYNNGRGYYFFDDENGNKVIYPIDKNIEGKNFLEFKDTNGYQFVKTIVKTIKEKNERYDEYYWYKPNDESGKAYKKISYYKYFEPLNLVIGTGEYVEDFEDTLKEKILKTIKQMIIDKNNYIFIFDENKNLIFHINENVLNNNLDSLTFLKGFYLNEKIKDYNLTYLYNNKEKVGYIKKIKEWNWYIGKSFYTDKINIEIEEAEKEAYKKYKAYLFYIFIISLILICLLLVVSVVVSEYLEIKFRDYKSSINNYVTENLKQKELFFQQSKLASMGEMINNIAHQWRQPLSIISTLSSGTILQKQCNIITEEQLYKNLELITDTSAYLSQTIEDFREFFKTDKEKRMFLLSSSIKRMETMLLLSIKNKNITLFVNEQKNITLLSYENELLQVLLNIVNNAKDVLEEQKIDQKIIIINTYKDEDFVYIEIKDNGGGINENIKDKIFDPYFTTKHQTQGTGIGLYMSKQIIERNMFGLLTAENVKFIYKEKEYQGALFKIKIPCK